MLDLQRYREGSLRSEVHFTRAAIWAHLAFGAAPFILMLFHEIFMWAAAAALWYLITILLITGVLSGMVACRWLLALSFFAFAIGGIVFIGHVLPTLKPDHPPLISHDIIHFWLGLLNVAYVAGGIFFLTNVRVRKACNIGFKLW